ncbi:unnamed protein product [Withania somnifera]
MTLYVKASKFIIPKSNLNPFTFLLYSSLKRLIFYSSLHYFQCSSHIKIRNFAILSNNGGMHKNPFSDSDIQRLILKKIDKRSCVINENFWVSLVYDSDFLVKILSSIRCKPSAALRLFKWAEGRKGFKYSEFSYCTILDILIQNGWVKSAYWVVERVISSNMDHVVDLLIDGYLNLKVSVDILNIFLRIYAKDANVEQLGQCLLVFEKMLRNEMFPDVKNCNRILRTLRDRNLVSKGREVYRMMGDFGAKCSIVTYNTMLDSFCREGEKKECYPNDVTYNILINGLSKKGEFDHARGLIGEMLDKGLKVSAYTYNPLIDGYCVKGMVVEALSLGEEMEVRGASPTVSTYNTFIYAHCRQGLESEARHWFSVMLKKKLVPYIMSYNTLIYGYCQLGDTNEAFSLLHDLRSRDLFPTAVTYNTIIDGLCRKGDIEDAKQLKDEMMRCGISLDVITYTILVRGSFMAGNLPMAKELFDEMLQRAGLLRLGDILNACKLQDEMSAKGFPPKIIIYNVFVNGIAKLGNLEEATELLHKMVGDGLMLDHVTYTSVIHAYLEFGNLNKARELFYEMISKDISPTVVRYTVMIHAHAGKGRLELARMYFSEMQQGGILPNVITYNTLINGLCKYRITNESYSHFAEMKARRIIPNKYTYTNLINQNCDLGNWQEVLRLFKETLDNGIQPDSFTYSAMLKNLGRDYKSHAIGYLDVILLGDEGIAQAKSLN